MASAPSTPRISQTPRRLGIRTVPPQTPECFNSVSVETPTPVKRRSSRDKKEEGNHLIVAVRVRPMNTKELNSTNVTDVVTVTDNELMIKASPPGNTGLELEHFFQYDHVFWSCDAGKEQYSSQEDVYVKLGKPLLKSAFSGYNACLFAYGQTGSGKSYSMMGPTTDLHINETTGIIPRFCHELFDKISSLDTAFTASIEVSYFEIYNEKIHDLLSTQQTTNSEHKTPLKVREHPVWGPYIVDLSVHPVNSYSSLQTWLQRGNKNRATTATAMNEVSSRSHSIFTIELSMMEDGNNDIAKRSKISLVDLAGSERLRSNSTKNDERMKQGVSINRSLLTLGKVISALSDQKKTPFVPYRDSVLTWLLRESLGGNSHTTMLATITPASNHVDETLSTLRYACQARTIVNRARINEDPNDRLIRELRAEVERLRALRKDYEQSSFSSQISDSSMQELEDLRNRLTETEQQLSEAQELWERRLQEAKLQRQQELLEVEKQKEELESRVRILKNLDINVEVSPYKTNFLEGLEEILNDNGEREDDDELNQIIKEAQKWSEDNRLDLTFSRHLSSKKVCVLDRQGRYAISSPQKLLNVINRKNNTDYIKSLKWQKNNSPRKKVSTVHIDRSFDQLSRASKALKSVLGGDDQLLTAYDKINKAVLDFENVLQSRRCRSPRAVKFKE